MSSQETNTDFLKSVQDLISKASRIDNFEKSAGIRLENIDTAAQYLDKAKPQSHMRPHKRRLLKLLDKLTSTINQLDQNNSKSSDLITILNIKKEYWDPVCYFLNRKEGFMIGYTTTFLRIIIGSTLDLILFYSTPIYQNFKIPVFTVTLTLIAIISVRKHKTERKFLK